MTWLNKKIRRHTIVLVILSLVCSTLLYIWLAQSVYPKGATIEDGLEAKLTTTEPVHAKSNWTADQAIVYFTVWTSDSQYSQLGELVGSLQRYLLQSDQATKIVVYGMASSLSRKHIYRLKQLASVEYYELIDNQAYEKANLTTILPWIFESLLFQYAKAIFIDIEHYFKTEHANQLSELANAIEIHGSLGVEKNSAPPSSRAKVLKTTSYALLGFSRSGFTNLFKLHLDCHRGINNGKCPSKKILDLSIQPAKISILKRQKIGLFRTYPTKKTLAKDTTTLVQQNTFTFATGADQAKLENWTKTRVCLGIRPADLEAVLERISINDSTKYGIVIYAEGRLQSAANLPSQIAFKHLNKSTSESDEVWEGLMLDRLFTEASRDKCNYFLRVAKPEFDLLEDWSTNLITFGSAVVAKYGIIIFIDGDSQFNNARQLSIHNAIEEGIINAVPIYLVGQNLSLSIKQVIRMWQHVELWDIYKVLFAFNPKPAEASSSGLAPPTKLVVHDEAIRLIIMERVIQTVLDFVAIIDANVAFATSSSLATFIKTLWKEKMVLVKDITTKEALQTSNQSPFIIEAYSVERFNQIHGHRLACLHGLECPAAIPPFTLPPPPNNWETVPYQSPEAYGLEDLSRPLASDPKARPQHHCNLLMRSDVITNAIVFGMDKVTSRFASLEMEEKFVKTVGKQRIAILVPTYHNEPIEAQNSPLVKTFLKSILSTIAPAEWDHYQIIFYVGYDDGDPVADNNQSQLIDAMLQIGDGAYKFIIKMVRLPASRWVSFLWNSLYSLAYNDGCDYFYQVNDDLLFGGSPGWITDWTTRLNTTHGIGVAGPCDALWKCKLLTQTFVSRRHFEIFNGSYFPLAIRDWFTDNWITQVYPPKYVHCSANFTVVNSNVATRYTVCHKPKWEKQLEWGKIKVAEFIKNLG